MSSESFSKRDAKTRCAQLLTQNSELTVKNSELERRLAQLLTRGFKNNEGISAAQLLLFLNELDGKAVNETVSAELAIANAELRSASEIDNENVSTSSEPRAAESSSC